MTIRIVRMSRSWSDRRTDMVKAIRVARHMAQEDALMNLFGEVSRILDAHLYSQREEEVLFTVDSLSASAIHGFIKRTMPLPLSVLAGILGTCVMHMPMEVHYLEKLERALRRTRNRLLIDEWRPWNRSGTKLLDIMPSQEDMMAPVNNPDLAWRNVGRCCGTLWDLLRREIPKTGPDQVLCYVPGMLAM